MKAEAPAPAVVASGLPLAWAAGTWRSLEAMVDPGTGLIADHIDVTLESRTRAAYTSVANVGGYLWSTVAAADLGLLDGDEARTRLATAISTLAAAEHHEPSGMWFTWYDAGTGGRLGRWPGTGQWVRPMVSCVDNAWLAVGLRVAESFHPASGAGALRRAMRWEAFYDPARALNHGAFYTRKPRGAAHVTEIDRLGDGAPLWYTDHHYDTAVSETRMVTYLCLVEGAAPPKAYFATRRDIRPSDRQDVVPSWNGSMFEALMPDLFVPEAEWGPRSWGRNHPAYVDAHIEASRRRGGWWGWSPCCDARGRYKEHGVPSVALNARRRHTGVVTPHAVFLARPHQPAAALDLLDRMAEVPGLYGEGGFADSLTVRDQAAATRHLAIDQAMILAALANTQASDAMRRRFASPEVEQVLRPVLARDVFFDS